MNRSRRVALALVLVVTVVGGVLAVARLDSSSQTTFCMGVGLITETHGRTPDQAFRAWAMEQGYEPGRWEQVEASWVSNGESSYSYEPRVGADNPSRLASVQVRGSNSIFKVDGACVGS